MVGCLKRKWEAEYNLMMGKLDKEKKKSDTSNLTMDIRVSHFYTFFELSYTLLTTQAHGL